MPPAASPTHSGDLEWRVREILRERVVHDRADYFRFSIPVVLLTPALLIAAIVAFLLFTGLGGSRSSLESPLAFFGSVACAIGGMTIALLAGQTPDTRRNPTVPLIVVGLAVGGIWALGSWTSWVETWPIAFWILVGALVLVALASLGWLYEPADRYYLGWVAGPILIDDPFTYRDDLDRGHIALGLASAIPQMILRAYAEVFGSGWHLRALDERDEDLAVRVLLSLERGGSPEALANVTGLEPRRAARMVRALSKLRLIGRREGRASLTADGRELIRTARGLRG